MSPKQIAVSIVAALSLVAVGFVSGKTFAGGMEPGSDADPLVSKSYVDQLVASLAQKSYVDQVVAGSATKSYVDQQVAGMATKAYVDQVIGALPAQGAATFGVVNLPKGFQLIGESGTEIVLRAGKATAIVSEKGGLLDATEGIDLKQGESIKTNHLLVIPVSDGRGLVATADAILIVKGPYVVRPVGL